MPKIKDVLIRLKDTSIKLKNFSFKHKILSVLIIAGIVAIIFFGGNYLASKRTSIRYVTQAVKTGDINVTVSGTGQVASSRDLSLVSQVSGAVTSVKFHTGDQVKKGDIIFTIDDADALKSIRDAELNLQTAQVSLEKLKEPADDLTVLQAEDALTQAQNTKTQTADDLQKAYDDGFTSVANAFLDLPTVITGLKNVLYGTDYSQSQTNADYYADAAKAYDDKANQYRQDAFDKYNEALTAYNQNFADYKSTSRYASNDNIESLVAETYNTTKTMADAVKSANDLIQFYEDQLTEHNLKPALTADTHLNALNGYTSKTNTHLSDLLSITQTIDDDKSALLTTESTIAEKQASLDSIKAGANPLDIQAQELSIQQKTNALTDAKENLAHYSITAPFDGVLATVSVANGDNVNSGTTLGSIINNQEIANITLNEVDASKVKVGQKVQITFDAFDGLAADGQVAEIDAVGTVSQGVVNYNAQISFISNDTRIKPGMSVTANVITDSATGVLTIPSSAVKTQGGSSYVQVMAQNGTVARKKVTTGISNDVIVEITDGLSAGDKVVTQTITTAAKKTTSVTTTTNSTTRGSGSFTGGGAGGGSSVNSLTRVVRGQ